MWALERTLTVAFVLLVASFAHAQTPDGTEPAPPPPVEPTPPADAPAAATPEAPVVPMVPAAPATVPVAPAPVVTPTPTPTPAPPVEPAAPAFAPDALVIVINSANGRRHFDHPYIRSIYLGSRQHWGTGQRIQAIQRSPKSPAGKAMFDKVLDMSPSSYRRRWQKKLLSGRGVAPKTAGSAAAVVQAVTRRPSAVGYVLGAEVPAQAPGVLFIEVKK